MSKNNKVNVVLNQLRNIGRGQRYGTLEAFNSDGSRHPSKCCTGKLKEIGRSNTGLRLYVHTSDTKFRIINWRMSQAVVTKVLAYVYWNKVAFNRARELGQVQSERFDC